MVRPGVWVAVCLLSCTASKSSEPTLTLEPCRLDGLGVEARCARFTVFEHRESKSGRELSLNVAVVPAISANPAPDPLFIFAGGPGQAATEAGAMLASGLERVRRRRDIVLVDQRGTGDSHPLDCDFGEITLAERFETEFDPEDLRRCREKLDADLTQYTTPIAMDDIDDVRAALGYDEINLWGGSYGTRAALIYLRRHPAHVRSVVLDGVAPTDIRLPAYGARDAQRAIDRLFEDCATTNACRAAFPDAQARWDALLARLGAEPEVVDVPDPLTGEPQRFELTRDGFASSVRALLYSAPLGAILPLIFERAERGDWGGFIAAATAFSSSMEESISVGMHLSVMCAEDVPRIRDEEIPALTEDTFVGRSMIDEIRRACATWPRATLPEGYYQPVTESAPTLILSGKNDPITPPSWGALVEEQLPLSRHVVVAGVGHGVTLVGCTPDLIAEFLDDPRPDVLDVTCLDRLRRPAFFTSFAGSGP